MSEDKKDDKKKGEVDKKLLEQNKELLNHVESLYSDDVNFEKKRRAFLMNWEWHSASSDLIEKLAVPKKTRHEATICQFIDFMVKKKFIKDEKKCIPVVKKGRKMTKAKREEMEKCLKKIKNKMRRERAEIIRNLSETAPCYRPKKTYVVYNEEYTKILAYPKRIYLKEMLEDYKLLITNDRRINDIQSFLKSDHLQKKLLLLQRHFALVTIEEKLAFPNLAKLEEILTEFFVTVEKKKQFKMKTINKILFECQNFMANTHRVVDEKQRIFNALLNDLVQILLKERRTLMINAIKQSMRVVLEEIEALRGESIHREKCVHEKIGPPDGRTADMEALFLKIDKLAQAKSRYLKHVLEEFSDKIKEQINEKRKKIEKELDEQKDEEKLEDVKEKNAYLKHRIERFNYNQLMLDKKELLKKIKKVEESLEKEKKSSVAGQAERERTSGEDQANPGNQEAIQKLEDKLKTLEEKRERMDEKLNEMQENLKNLENYKEDRKVAFIGKKKPKKPEPLTEEKIQAFQEKFKKTVETLSSPKEVRLYDALVSFKDILVNEIEDNIKSLVLAIERLNIESKDLAAQTDKNLETEKKYVADKIQRYEQEIQRLKDKEEKIKKYWKDNIGKPEIDRLNWEIKNYVQKRKVLYRKFKSTRQKYYYQVLLRRNKYEINNLKNWLKTAKMRNKLSSRGSQKSKILSDADFDSKYPQTRGLLNRDRVKRKLKATLDIFGKQMVLVLMNRQKKLKKMKKNKEYKDRIPELNEELKKVGESLKKIKAKIESVRVKKTQREKPEISEDKKKERIEHLERLALPKFYFLHDTIVQYDDILEAVNIIEKKRRKTFADKLQIHLSNLKNIYNIWLGTDDRSHRKELTRKAKKDSKRLAASIRDQKWRPQDDDEIEKLALPKIPKLEATYDDFKFFMSQPKRERIENDLKQRKMMKPEFLEQLRIEEEMATKKREEKRLKHQENSRRVMAKIQKKIRAELLDEIYSRLLKIVPKMVLNRKLPPIMSEKFKLLQNAAYTFLMCLNGCPVNSMENSFYLSLASIIAEYIIKTLHTVINAEKIATEGVFMQRSVETKTGKRNKELLEFMKNVSGKR